MMMSCEVIHVGVGVPIGGGGWGASEIYLPMEVVDFNVLSGNSTMFIISYTLKVVVNNSKR